MNPDPCFAGLSRARRRPPASVTAGTQSMDGAGKKTRPTGVSRPRVESVVGEGFDDHPGAVGRQRLQKVAGGTCGIAHVVKGIEDQGCATIRVGVSCMADSCVPQRHSSDVSGVVSRRRCMDACDQTQLRETAVGTGNSMLDVIGRTPVVQLAEVVPDDAADVFVKLEWFNPTGSYKDRMALAMIEEAERRGDLRPGMSVVEYTAGSTGSSLAYICAVKGYRFRVVSSDAFAAEKLKTMAAFGAELTLIESDRGTITPELISRVIDKAREYALEPDTYWTNQLHNGDSLVGYR